LKDGDANPGDKKKDGDAKPDDKKKEENQGLRPGSNSAFFG
jgi:hypothetical protein